MSNGYTIHENLPGDAPAGSRVHKIMQYIAANIEKDLGLRTVGQHFGLSPTTIERLFKRHLQRTYGQYVEVVRLQKAFELITQHDTAIKTAMYDAGYKNRDTFNKAFKRKFGHSPSHFKTG